LATLAINAFWAIAPSDPFIIILNAVRTLSEWAKVQRKNQLVVGCRCFYRVAGHQVRISGTDIAIRHPGEMDVREGRVKNVSVARYPVTQGSLERVDLIRIAASAAIATTGESLRVIAITLQSSYEKLSSGFTIRHLGLGRRQQSIAVSMIVYRLINIVGSLFFSSVFACFWRDPIH
jgi:hypothetical protein